MSNFKKIKYHAEYHIQKSWLFGASVFSALRALVLGVLVLGPSVWCTNVGGPGVWGPVVWGPSVGVIFYVS